MPLSQGFLDELRALVADLTGIGYAANENLASIVGRISQHINVPLKGFASAVPDAKLNFGPQVITLGDGALMGVAPVSGTVPSPASPAGSLNFQTGAVTGITLQFRGAAFAAIPASTTGKFRRFVFCLRSGGQVNMNYGAEQTTQAALENAGTLAGAIDGQFKFSIDCVAIVTNATGQYKSATAVASVIQNADITRYPGGSGGGSGSGGAGSLAWYQVDGLSPPPLISEFSGNVYQFQPFASGQQSLQADIYVPASYVAGKQITMSASFYSPGVTGTNVPQVQAYLVRLGTDPISAPPNSQTFTASLNVPATANVPQAATIAITDATGQINGVAVAPGNLIRILLSRATDTDAQDYRFLPDSTGVATA